MEIECTRVENRYEYAVWNENYSQTIASARVKEEENCTEIEVINVVRERRGEGVGSALLKKIISDFQDVNLITWTFGERVAWYERNGFKTVEEKGGLVRLALSPS